MSYGNMYRPCCMYLPCCKHPPGQNPGVVRVYIHTLTVLFISKLKSWFCKNNASWWFLIMWYDYCKLGRILEFKNTCFPIPQLPFIHFRPIPKQWWLLQLLLPLATTPSTSSTTSRGVQSFLVFGFQWAYQFDLSCFAAASACIFQTTSYSDAFFFKMMINGNGSGCEM